MDDSLLTGLFARQGLQVLPVPPALQAEFAASARDAQKMVEKLAPPGTFERVSTWIGSTATATRATGADRARRRRRRRRCVGGGRCRRRARRADRAALWNRRARRHGLGAHRQADRRRSVDGDARAGAVKWYFGGIAGDELQMLERIRREQLDGIVSGGMACEKLSPSMRILRIPACFKPGPRSSLRRSDCCGRDRSRGFSTRTASSILAEAGVGPDAVFSREPVRSMADLKRVRCGPGASTRCSGDVADARRARGAATESTRPIAPTKRSASTDFSRCRRRRSASSGRPKRAT